VSLLATAAKQGIVLVVTQAYRTFEEQAKIYAQGRTRPGRIVTYAPPGFSWHNWRKAFDVAIQVFPGDTTPRDLYDGPWEVVGEMGEKLGLEWGGHWKVPDLPHFQFTGRASLSSLRAKYPNGLGT